MTDPDSRAELPACPFCNGSAEFIESSGDWGYTPDTYYVSCQKCDCETAQYGTAKKAIAAWTRRAPVSGFAAGIEAAAKVCEESAAAWAFEAATARDPNARKSGVAYEMLASGFAARIRSLTPSPDAGVVEKWMGIERAPKDGTLIDLWVVTNDHGSISGERITDCCWHDWTDHMYSPVTSAPAKGTGWCRFYSEWNRIEEDYPRWTNTVTHWMPIPTPPAL